MGHLALSPSPAYAEHFELLTGEANNNTPWPTSTYITDAEWTSSVYTSPEGYSGDHVPFTWAGDGSVYMSSSDGANPFLPGMETQEKYFVEAEWTNGTPSNPPAAPTSPLTYTWLTGRQDDGVNPEDVNFNDWGIGLTSVRGTLFKTNMSGGWSCTHTNTPWIGNSYISWSTDGGQNWTNNGAAGMQFPVVGGMYFLQEGKDTASPGAGEGNPFNTSPDGYVYAISSERELNGRYLYMGRTLGDQSPANFADPANWQWFNGYDGGGDPTWTAVGAQSPGQPLLDWPRVYQGAGGQEYTTGNFGYPNMSYSPLLDRYLLHFFRTRPGDDGQLSQGDDTCYTGTPEPNEYITKYWQNGHDYVMLEAENPWGPFKFVARQESFSSAYTADMPLAWQYSPGTNQVGAWMKFTGQWASCHGIAPDCYGSNTANLRQLRLCTNGDCPAAAPPTEIPVPNAGFEDGVLAPWSPQDGGGGVNASVSAGAARTGGFGVDVSGGGAWVEQTITGLTQNTAYTVRGYARVSGGGEAVIGAYQYDGTGAMANSDPVTSTSYGGELSAGFTTGSQTTATIYCWRTIGASGSAQCDDFSLWEP